MRTRSLESKRLDKIGWNVPYLQNIKVSETESERSLIAITKKSLGLTDIVTYWFADFLLIFQLYIGKARADRKQSGINNCICKIRNTERKNLEGSFVRVALKISDVNSGVFLWILRNF